MPAEKSSAEWGTILLSISVFAVLPLLVAVRSVSADDEVLDAAEAVREMILEMDIPQEEKNKYLAQIGAVEGIQEAAIRTDISAVLLEFELALDAWVGNDKIMKRPFHYEVQRLS